MENAVTLESIHAPTIYPVSQSAAEFEHELKAFSYREFRKSREELAWQRSSRWRFP